MVLCLYNFIFTSELRRQLNYIFKTLPRTNCIFKCLVVTAPVPTRWLF